MINLHTLKPNKGATKRRKIVGRGNGSGHGTYSGRGMKGQKSRTGGGKGLKRLGMKTILAQTPKLGGFNSQYIALNTISVGELDKLFLDGDVVNPKILDLKKNFSSKKRGIKILGKGKLTKKLDVKAHDFSITARKAITEAGGKAVIIPIYKKR